ncbi:MAG: EamA family transporter [Sphingomonadaceae bacterium]
MSYAPLAKAAGWALVSSTAFAFLWLLARLLSTEFHPFMLAMWAIVLSLPWMLPMLLLTTPGLLRPDRLVPHARPAAHMLVATFAGFAAIAAIPLVEVAAMLLAIPVLAALAAALLAGRGAPRATLALGVAGLALLFLPFPPSGPGTWAALLAAVAAGGAFAVTDRLQLLREDPRSITLWGLLLMSPAAVLLALPFDPWPTAHAWPLLFGMGACSAAGWLALWQMLKLTGPRGLVFSGALLLAFVASGGALLFGEHARLSTIAGALLLAIGGLPGWTRPHREQP